MNVPQAADGPTRIDEIADGIYRISTSIHRRAWRGDGAKMRGALADALEARMM